MSIRPGSPPRESPDAPDTLGSPAALGSSAPAAVGLLLAAGAGRRMGGPKGLLRDADGTPWVARAAGALRDGGCEPVIVIVGAAASEVAALVPAWAHVVPAQDWADGMGASLRAGLAAAEHSSGPGRAELSGTAAELAVVTLVDLPGVDAAVVARLLDRCPRPGQGRVRRGARASGRPRPRPLGGRRRERPRRRRSPRLPARARGDARRVRRSRARRRRRRARPLRGTSRGASRRAWVT